MISCVNITLTLTYFMLRSHLIKKNNALWSCVLGSQLVDNVPILQIDMVWCYFMLRDIRWLSEAGIRLAKAREGIERSHGKDASRVRILQSGCYPELAL